MRNRGSPDYETDPAIFRAVGFSRAVPATCSTPQPVKNEQLVVTWVKGQKANHTSAVSTIVSLSLKAKTSQQDFSGSPAAAGSRVCSTVWAEVRGRAKGAASQTPWGGGQ